MADCAAASIGRRSFLLNAAGMLLMPTASPAAAATPLPLNIITRDTEAIGGPAIRHGGSFAAATGIAVNIVRAPFDQLYDQIMIGFITGRSAYDVVIVPSAWLGDLAPYLATVPEWVIEADAFTDIYPAYRDLMMRWDGGWKAVTIDGDLQIGTYRTDLLVDPSHKRAFAARYGRTLAPPETWEDYRCIAEYFHGRKDGDGRTIAGTVEAFAPRGQRIWTLFSRAAAYVNQPDRRGAMFFEPETMTPTIDNPGWVRALNEYIAIFAFAPADAATMDSYEVRTRFVTGRAAMNIDWTDTGILAADPRTSKVADRIGFFVLPGSEQVWNPVARKWDELGRLRHVPFMAFGGWIAAVPADRPRKDVAWQYVAWFANPQRSAADVLDGTSGINPYRYSHLASLKPWLGNFDTPERADAYLRTIRTSLESPDAVSDLRIPGFRAYAAALDASIGAALTGAVSPEVALSTAAATWERITDRLGREGQRRHYRRAMGLGE